MAVSIRQLYGYTLHREPPVIQVRQVYGYTLGRQRQIPKGVTGAQAFYALINRHASFNFSASNSSLGKPRASNNLPGSGLPDTVVTLSAGLKMGLTGSIDLYYFRIPLKEAFVNPESFTLAGETSVQQLLAKINAFTGMVLSMDDLEEQEIPANASSVQLTAKADSLFFLPGTTVTIGSLPTLSVAMVVKNLSGFEPA